MKISIALCAVAGALSLCACSQQDRSPQSNVAQPVATGNAVENKALPEPDNVAAPNAAQPSPASQMLGLEGLGTLRIGAPVPKDSGWAERGAQTGDTCRTVSSPAYPGVYAIVGGGKVRRITVGTRSDVKLVEGIGVGSSEADVVGAFPGFRSEPHKYEEAPAKYLTAPNAARGDAALRFEIGRDGKVAMMHVGTMPVLAYVEGCS
ncbi:hypothetical protein [Sphingobium olei]|uniref:Secreted protein n=1 Tax=Sphingobium olei TaxID=420955 RepID=A0ABW3P438_9SPHN|nr:hypothetical protein [Sphingobium sp.]